MAGGAAPADAAPSAGSPHVAASDPAQGPQLSWGARPPPDASAQQLYAFFQRAVGEPSGEALDNVRVAKKVERDHLLYQVRVGSAAVCQATAKMFANPEQLAEALAQMLRAGYTKGNVLSCKALWQVAQK